MRAVAIIDQIVALLGELRAELQVDSAHAPNPPPARHSDEAANDGDFNEHNLIEVTGAVERFCFPANTIRFWCRKNGDGVRRGGRWLVSIPRVQRRLNGS